MSTKAATIASGAVEAAVADASVILFDRVWRELVEKHGIERMVFPREVVWLSGAPGAGKGTMSGFILKERDIHHIFEVSSLLKTPEMAAAKARGVLIGDRDVLMATIEELIKDRYRHGVIVDGFPRTVLQAECIKLLHSRLTELWEQRGSNAELAHFKRRPNFSICVLYVDEAESVKRQLGRGAQLQMRNKMCAETGVGQIEEVRATDIDPEAARARYRIFKEENYAALQSIKDKFLFHFVPADGPPADVEARIRKEFAYQSAHDLSEETNLIMRDVESSASVIKSARGRLVSRLNKYALEHRARFTEAVAFINTKMMHIVRRQGLMGSAIIRSNDAALEDPQFLNMVLDVLAERGFTVTLDVLLLSVPSHLAPRSADAPATAAAAEPDLLRIVCRVERSWAFSITFPKPQVRRNE